MPSPAPARRRSPRRGRRSISCTRRSPISRLLLPRADRRGVLHRPKRCRERARRPRLEGAPVGALERIPERILQALVRAAPGWRLPVAAVCFAGYGRMGDREHDADRRPLRSRRRDPPLRADDRQLPQRRRPVQRWRRGADRRRQHGHRRRQQPQAAADRRKARRSVRPPLRRPRRRARPRRARQQPARLPHRRWRDEQPLDSRRRRTAGRRPQRGADRRCAARVCSGSPSCWGAVGPGRASTRRPIR